jgi:hypothetical protein
VGQSELGTKSEAAVQVRTKRAWVTQGELTISTHS